MTAQRHVLGDKSTKLAHLVKISFHIYIVKNASSTC